VHAGGWEADGVNRLFGYLFPPRCEAGFQEFFDDTSITLDAYLSGCFDDRIGEINRVIRHSGRTYPAPTGTFTDESTFLTVRHERGCDDVVNRGVFSLNYDVSEYPFVFSSMPPRNGGGFLIQSTFHPATSVHGNFEVLLSVGGRVIHFFHEEDGDWQRGAVLTARATGDAALIQSDFGDGAHKNFEAVVPEGGDLVHYYKDNFDPETPWQRGAVIASTASAGASLILSDYGDGSYGNFELVALEGRDLVHYSKVNDGSSAEWQRGAVITSRATGPGTLLQSSYYTGPHGNFEVVVPEGNELVHYYMAPGQSWRRGGVITNRATGPASFVQSDLGTGTGNFEVAALEGNEIVHYYRENATNNAPWRRGAVISTRATGPAAFIQSDFGDGDHANFEVIVPEAVRWVHYYKENAHPETPWTFGSVVFEMADSDCDADGVVRISDLILGVQIALGAQPLSRCLALDRSGDARVTIAELVHAVTLALQAPTVA